MRQVFLFAGQSNMSGYSPTVTLQGSGLVTQPGHPGSAPDFVATSDQTALNEWDGAAAASADTGTKYTYPTLSAYPCLYNENTRGDSSGVFDAWGSYAKQSPLFPAGALGIPGSYGLELSFLAGHLTAYPSTPIAAVKQSLGGTSLRGDWLPDTVVLGTARGGGPTTITLAASDFGTPAAYVGLKIRVVSGAGAGQEQAITAFDSTTKVATVSGWSPAPDATSQYGIERLQFQLLRTMLTQAAARLDSSDGPGNWQWAGFVWMQGESGAHSAGTAANDGQYLSDARALFAAVRGLTRAGLPVLVGRIGDNWTKDNAYLASIGFPWGAIDASINGSDGEVAGPQATRDSFNAGAYARRATQAVLGSDPNCVMWNNDGYQTRPYSNDKFFYHWHHSGNLAAGERAFAAYQRLLGRRVRVRTPLRRFRARG